MKYCIGLSMKNVRDWLCKSKYSVFGTSVLATTINIK